MWKSVVKITLALTVMAVVAGCAAKPNGDAKWNPRTQSYESRGGD